jgi:hypothetical protein
MDVAHVFNMDVLKQEFQEIMLMNTDILDKKEMIIEKIERLKKIYNELVKNNTKKIFLFCLDSFYFQYKLLNIEMENLCKLCILINNRMYGDYYKLYNIIFLHLKEKGFSVSGGHELDHKKFPIYKDLEPYREYSVENIVDIHYEILKFINEIHNYYLSKESKIFEYSTNTQVGISISNFIHTLEYDNCLLREQIHLYSSYISYFHDIQRTYLNRLMEKINLFHKEIDQDILTNKKNLKPKPTYFGGGMDSGLAEYFNNASTNRINNIMKDFFPSDKKRIQEEDTESVSISENISIFSREDSFRMTDKKKDDIL